VAVSFIGGGNHSTWRKPTTYKAIPFTKVTSLIRLLQSMAISVSLSGQIH